MILKKLIQLAFLLKDVKEIDSIFEIKDGVKSFIPEKCDKVFNEDLIARICEIVTVVKASLAAKILLAILFYLQWCFCVKLSYHLFVCRS